MTVPTVRQPLGTNEVYLAGNRYWVKGQVRKRKTTQWASPVRTGNPERADQQFASEVIWDDTTGGLGVVNMDERESPDRISDSSLDTRIKKQITLLPKRNPVTLKGAAFGAAPIGGVDLSIYTFVVGGVNIKRLTGSNPDMYYYDTGTTSWVNSGGVEYVLPGAATGKPLVWKGNVWIPCGASGLVRYNVSAATFATIATPTATHLFIFDEDLCWIDAAGSLGSTDDNTTTPAVTFRGSIDTFTRLNGAVVWHNGIGDPAPYVATDRALHVVDYWSNHVYDSGIQFTDGNLDNGKGLTVWDARIWHGKGANAHEVVDGARVVRGPNTGDGLLTDKQGHIVNFNTSFDNFIIAAMDGGTSATSSLMAYNRRGWHTLTQATASTGVPLQDALGVAVVGIAKVGYAEAGQPRVVAFDDFTGADSGAAIGAAVVGGSWTAGVGTWGLSNNLAYLTAATGNAVATLTTTVSDCSIQVTLYTNVADMRLVFRLSDTSNYLYVERTSTGYILGKRDTGANSTLASYVTTPLDGDEIRVVASGSAIKVLINGYERVSYTSTFNSTAVKHGIGSLSGASGRWNDFVIGSEFRRVSWCHYSAQTTPGYLYYNEGTTLKYLKLYDNTDNPYQAATADFEPYGYVIYPWFDAQLAEVQKTALSVQLRVSDTSVTSTVKVYYQMDNSSTWTQMYTEAGAVATLTSDGVYTLFFDTDQHGTQFYNVRLKVELESGSPTASPRMAFVKIRYLRDLPVLYGYDLVIDLGKNQPDQRTFENALTDLEEAVESRLMVDFAFQSGKATDTKTVLILQYGGPWDTGTDRRSEATLSLVEVVPQ